MKFNFMVDFTKKLNELNVKLQGKRKPSLCLAVRSCLFQKYFFFGEDMESSKLLHFENLKQYRDETKGTIDTN